MKYSASDLIKFSAMKMVYLRNKKERIVTAIQKKGTIFQSKISSDVKEKNKGNYAEELRGIYVDDINDFQIFFCIDLFSNDEFYEIKSIFDENGNNSDDYEQWYLDNSILQVAFYKSLLIEGNNNILYTPKFRLKEGYEFKSQSVNINANYYLLFGNKRFLISITDTKPFIAHYTNKILHLQDYETAKKWDNKFKHHDYDFLSSYIKINKLKLN